MELFDSTTGLVTAHHVTATWDLHGVALTTSTGMRGRLIRVEDAPQWYLVRLHCAGGFVATVHRDEWRAFEAERTAAALRVREAAEALPATWQRLSADEQRRRFGGVPFGRRQVLHNPASGTFHVKRVVAFGQDFDIQTWSYLDVAALLKAGDTVVHKRD